MSYLHSPRLVFSGQFQADPSTVNNDPTHFDNSTFQPNYQDYGQGAENGWWNPDGTGNWRLIGCKVISVTYKDGSSTDDPSKDPIIGLALTDTDSRVAGKIVDLDSQQQMVSELWGVIVRLVSGDKNLFIGEYQTAAFTNIWMTRSPALKGDTCAAAVYQSVIKNLVWDLANFNSRYLKELNEVSPNQVSIQFTVDRFNMTHDDPQFSLGRIAGSIGPYYDGEPIHWLPGRQLFPIPNPKYNYAVALLDENLHSLILDMGNAFQFDENGDLLSGKSLTVAVLNNAADKAENTYIGNIENSSPGWYTHTAGLVTFALNEEIFSLLQTYPLAIFETDTGTDSPTIVFEEQVSYVRADQFVSRLNEGESFEVNLKATYLGKPKPGATINLEQSKSAFGPTPPAVGTPENAIAFPASVATDENGYASINVVASDPGNPREYIDGQIYGIVYKLDTQDYDMLNPSDFVSLLVYSSVPESSIQNPDWDRDIQPIMQQYANLYPLMSKGIFNLADKEVVHNNAEILSFVFSKELTDPNYMPATRDLSAGKQRMILRYLETVLSAQKAKTSVSIKKL
ncbi:MAG TPA: hypothetical protein VK957_13605 [Lunatimonas sp.]|nr:hypothetical protein [Lunatimonas sp.]